jgi:hypothetical protein
VKKTRGGKRPPSRPARPIIRSFQIDKIIIEPARGNRPVVLLERLTGKRTRRKKRPWGRPKITHPIEPELAQKIIRQMPVIFITGLFSRRAGAEEWMRRYKHACRSGGYKYDRKSALTEAADIMGLDESKLDNWLRRSKRSRARY